MGASTTKLHGAMHDAILEIFKMVEEITGVTEAAIASSNRSVATVDARKILANILRKRLQLTCYQVAHYMKIDHSSVVYYEKMHLVHIEEPEYRRMYSAVSGMIAINATKDAEKLLSTKLKELHTQTEELLNTLNSQVKILDLLKKF